MCGLVAIYAYDDAAQHVDELELLRIRNSMKSRGPDGNGLWLNSSKRLGMGHQRLSIIDISDAASQPMVSTDNQLAITFNGEIYNYQALRQRLQDKGYQFKSHSDTEVLLHLYSDLGESMVHELRGMFAFAIWDEKKKGLFLARDPYGIKPLYYADDGKTIRVASQVKALHAGGCISNEKDAAGMVGYYLLGSVPEPFTLWADIKMLPAGHTLWVANEGKSKIKSYHAIAKDWKKVEGRSKDETQNVELVIREALLDSLKHHLVADVPIAIFLSAGVDSGAILGLVRELAPDLDIQTVTLVFEEYKNSQHDESPLAKKIAKRYGAQHTMRYVSRKEFEEDLPKIFEAMDQPSIDGINTWFVSKATKELGVKVALSGVGGDELFGGYPSFQNVPRWHNQLKYLSQIPLLGKATRFIVSKINTKRSPKFAGMIEYGGSYAGAWLLHRGIFMPWELTKLLPKALALKGLKQLAIVDFINSQMDAVNVKGFAKVAVLESSLYMRNQLLRDADWAGMAHSVEIRTPLVDVELLKKSAPMLLTSKNFDGKNLLGNAPSKGLPRELINRQKTGFTTPIKAWMNDVLKIAPSHQHWSRNWACEVAKHFELNSKSNGLKY